ncbi:K+/H+ antiporter subunit F [Altererythrobacter sp. B11]|uniref:K+/H+ antiporter subunit F n=1 Tax=Altererythrobacter sp. B11 TaxID=2060312 RepID=UPI000DC6EACC|nr:K+/H+ antiporter subunit F [Altererythrobacter sp. B11]BBC71903.1 K+/H+ antiporter subunit F [Altererythrobacter sp. B11]
MIALALSAGFTMIAAAIALNAWRLFAGPTRGDRILALDTMIINAIALIVLFGIYERTAFYFEAALLLAMVGFVGTVAYAKFLLRGDIVE